MPGERQDIEAFDALRSWMRDEGISQQALADSCGVRQQSVSQWWAGRARPKARARIIIQALSKGRVLVEMWLTAAEREPIRIVELDKSGTEG